MIHSTWSHPKEVAAFVSNGLWGGRREITNCQAVGFFNEIEGLIAGVLFHNYDPDTSAIELTAYSAHRKWLNKARVREIFRYPFDDVRLRLCVARMSEHNTRPLRMWRAFGASLHRIPDLRADGEAEVIAVLRLGDWKNSKFAR